MQRDLITGYSVTDNFGIRKISNNLVFQLMHPQRVRRLLKPQLDCLQNFNPRTREGCDIKK